MYKNLLVTGAAGFIGRTLIRLLSKNGYVVDALDNFRFSNKNQIEYLPNVRWIYGDTRNYDLVNYLVQNKDAVIHLAAPSSFIMHEENDLEACDFTLIGFKTVMEAVRKNNIKKIVWASTSAVYEGNLVPYHEKMILDPPDSKAGCKLFCEQEAKRYSERYGITCIGMRPFSVYGIGEHTKGGYANVISLFAWAMLNNIQPVIWGDGTQTRDWIYVEDVAQAFIAGLEKDISTQEFNLGSGLEHSFNDVVKFISNEISFPLEPQYVPIPIKIYAHRLWADMTYTKNVLGFEPKINIIEGIRRVIKSICQLDKKSLSTMQMYYEKLNNN